jgi:hypothetical protein
MNLRHMSRYAYWTHGGSLRPLKSGYAIYVAFTLLYNFFHRLLMMRRTTIASCNVVTLLPSRTAISPSMGRRAKYFTLDEKREARRECVASYKISPK